MITMLDHELDGFLIRTNTVDDYRQKGHKEKNRRMELSYRSTRTTLHYPVLYYDDFFGH